MLAADITEQAVEAYRELAAHEPDAFARFAASLYNQSYRLGELGRREEALSAGGRLSPFTAS